jgi:pimeloyl-ACP methyl ester carboxylesterase
MSNTITPTVFYRTLNMEGLEIFYREAGPRDAPTVLLLHGFPASSHMFRNLIPMLRINIMSLPQTSLDMAKAQHRRSTISTIPTNG